MNFAIGVVDPPVEGQGGGGTVVVQRRDSDLMGSVLLRVRELLKKPGCGDTIFAGGIAKGHDPMDVLTKIVSGERYGSLNYKNLGADFGGEETPSIPYRLILQKRVTITMNSYSDGSGKYWNDANATDDLRAIYLIHELGHAFNDLFGKGSSTIENDGTLFGKVNEAAEDRNKARTDKCLQ